MAVTQSILTNSKTLSSCSDFVKIKQKSPNCSQVYNPLIKFLISTDLDKWILNSSFRSFAGWEPKRNEKGYVEGGLNDNDFNNSQVICYLIRYHAWNT